MSMPRVVPFALKDAPALIERVFPAQKISVEAQKERKAGSGQTLTALGSYWKGRKPLILARATVLGCLLPATDDPAADLAIFEKLMAIDDEAFLRREPKFAANRPENIARWVHLENPEIYFEMSGSDVGVPGRFPANLADYPGLSIRWAKDLEREDREVIKENATRNYLASLSYMERVGISRRPEGLDAISLYGPIWDDVNSHLGRFGVNAHSFPELVEQLGILRYGHRPKVGDTFCGGGSIPFEAARLGCDVHASDLNPIACMLTWGALNIIGADEKTRVEIEKTQKEVAAAVDREIAALGIEHNSRGDRAKAYLYCLETRCPQTGWMVPMSPSWIISKNRNVVARLVPEHQQKRFRIEVVTGVSQAEMEEAGKGTVQDQELAYTLDGQTHRTSIKTIRGDFRLPDGTTGNKLRKWEVHDFKPRPDDIFQERLYAIQWITKETLQDSRQNTYFSAVTENDLERERNVETIVEANLAKWQEEGLVPDMEIEPGDNNDQPIRERGWTFWQHLFSARQLLVLSLINKYNTGSSKCLDLCQTANIASRLCRINSSAGQGGAVKYGDVFYNQSLNTFFNYGIRGSLSLLKSGFISPTKASFVGSSNVHTAEASRIDRYSDVYVTDPPYADAVNYHEIAEYFIAWLRKNPPPPFDQWTWDSRRALAIKGDGEDFRRGMVGAYRAMADHMPDNGMQVVMFTHQDTGVWSDMVSILWAAGLRVMSAWYIATETTSELKKGGYVQGTVILALRKRVGEEPMVFTQEILPEIHTEVERQIGTLTGLNQAVRGHGRSENVFEDADLQMAGYAAALRVLTKYTQIDGEDMTKLALRPRVKGETTLVDEIVQHAAEVANNLLVPDGLTRDAWLDLKGVERFYLKMLDIETTGAKKLDNYQNFAKAFRVENYQQLMASVKPNAARLKAAKEFTDRDFAGSVFAGTLLGETLYALRELQRDGVDPRVIGATLRDSLPDPASQLAKVAVIAAYLDRTLSGLRESEARAARVLQGQITSRPLG